MPQYRGGKNTAKAFGDKMREIKFRAWDKENKRMCSVGWLRWNPDFTFRQAQCIFSVDGGGVFDDVDELLVDGENIQLMQFTGLRDKNGKEIYEGDIFAIPICATDDVVYKYYNIEYEVRWTKGHWEIHTEVDGRTELLEHYNKQGTVIGNIYETPELIEKAR